MAPIKKIQWILLRL